MVSQSAAPASLAHRTWKWLGPGFLLGLFGLIVFAYAPSLRHGPRADQWQYLTETMDEDTFVAVLGKTWSYSRTRLITPGDSQLFRPLLFAVLAAEKAFFGNHFRAWQATGIVLHMMICTLLFIIMRRLRRVSAGVETPTSMVDALPFVLTTFFALNFAIAEQVIWTHISGYLVFTLLILIALWCLIEALVHPELSRRSRAALLVSAWLLTLLSAFTYELGQLCAVCTGLILAGFHVQQRQFRKGLLLLALFVGIVAIYQGVNRFDRRYHHGMYHDDKALALLLKELPTEASVQNLGRYLSYAVVQPFMPLHCTCRLRSVGKMCLEEQLWSGQVEWDARAVGCGGMLVVAAALTMLGMLRLVRARPLLMVMLLVLSIVAGHVSLIVFGRMNLRPIELSINPYYIYVTLLFVIIGAAVPLLGLDRLEKAWSLSRSGVAVLIAGLLVLSVASLDVVRRVNEGGASQFQKLRDDNRYLSKFLERHAEEDVRIAIIHGPNGLPRLTPNLMVLYHTYFDAVSPNYFLYEDGTHLRVVSVDSWRAEHPAQEPILCPELVSVRPVFYIFHAVDRYYAVPHRLFSRFLAGYLDECRGPHATLEGMLNDLR
jgi:hypothetical protein